MEPLIYYCHRYALLCSWALFISPCSRSFKTFNHELELYHTTVKTQAVIRDARIWAYLGCAHLFVHFLLSFSYYFLGKGVYLRDEVRQYGYIHWSKYPSYNLNHDLKYCLRSQPPNHALRLKYFDFSQPWLHFVDILNHLMTSGIDYCMEVNKTIFI